MSVAPRHADWLYLPLCHAYPGVRRECCEFLAAGIRLRLRVFHVTHPQKSLTPRTPAEDKQVPRWADTIHALHFFVRSSLSLLVYDPCGAKQRTT